MSPRFFLRLCRSPVAPPPDTTPIPFSFTTQTDVALGTVITSNVIEITGYDAPIPISVSGGEYQTDGDWTSSAGTLSPGQEVRVRHTSSATLDTPTVTTLIAGGVSGTFTSRTSAVDTTPDAFSFTAQTGKELSTAYDSNSVTISGINSAAAVTAVGGTVSINGGSQVTSGSVGNGQTIVARLTSSSSYSTIAQMTVTVGGVARDFQVTTKADPTPTPSVSWPTGVTAPDILPAATGVYNNTDVTPLTTLAAIVAAVNAASAGQEIFVAGGTYTTALNLAGINKGTGNPVRIRSADPDNPAFIQAPYKVGGSPTGPGAAGTNGAIKLAGAKGIAIVGLKATITGLDVDHPSVIFCGAGDNIWIVDNEIFGEEQADHNNYGKGLTTSNNGATNVHVYGNHFHNLQQGVSTINASGFQVHFNDFDHISGDPIHYDSTSNVISIGNSGVDFRDVGGSHADMIQLATSSVSLSGCSNHVIFMNGCLGDPTQPLQIQKGDVPPTQSGGRPQGITIQDDNGPANNFQNILIKSNTLIGCIWTSIQINIGLTRTGTWDNIVVDDNDAIHVTSSVSGDTISRTWIKIGDGNARMTNGAVTNNRARQILNSENPNVTGQQGTIDDLTQVIATYADAQARYADYLAVRAQYRTLAGL